jgi:FAD synthetase
MVFGTFDILHEGHLNFFAQARGLAPDPQLIVSVARDASTERIKGESPKNNELFRMKNVEASHMVDEVVLGDREGFIAHIVSARPDIIALGYDQKSQYVTELQAELDRVGLKTQVVRLKPYKPHIYKTSKLQGK